MPQGVKGSSQTEKARKNAELSRAWYARNPDRNAANGKAYEARNPGRRASYTKNWRLKKLEKLAGRRKPKTCDVCKKRRPQICYDHCHGSDCFRGWICSNCNFILGLAGDSSKLLHKLGEYLELSAQKLKELKSVNKKKI